MPHIAALTQKWTAFLAILLTSGWLWTPRFALLLLAGLQSLPQEPFEAAQIDAASAWRTFRYITLPMLRPVIVVCVVIRAIDAFRTFDIVWTISGGGPARATEVFSIYADLLPGLSVPEFFWPRLSCRRDRCTDHRGVRHGALSPPQSLGGGFETSAVQSLPAVAYRNRFFDELAPGGRRALFVLGVIGVCLLFAFPVFWLVLTSLLPVLCLLYYAHRGTDPHFDNFHEVLTQEIVLRALWSSFA